MKPTDLEIYDGQQYLAAPLLTIGRMIDPVHNRHFTQFVRIYTLQARGYGVPVQVEVGKKLRWQLMRFTVKSHTWSCHLWAPQYFVTL